jgi:hypothetical protein
MFPPKAPIIPIPPPTLKNGNGRGGITRSSTGSSWSEPVWADAATKASVITKKTFTEYL